MGGAILGFMMKGAGLRGMDSRLTATLRADMPEAGRKEICLIVTSMPKSLCRNAIFVKMLWGYVDGASKPGYGPTVKADAFKHCLVAQGSEDCILLNQGQAVEDATASVVEGETEPVVVKRLGSCDPFEFIVLSHRNSVKGVNGCESLAVFHPVPIGHQLVLVLV